ncbi:MAG TPA: hypothetical protein DGG94_20225 [Micromonosporaceae bacterium]|nr:hypothetical protein [Micromonosporaceae bacterium]HCU52092.1 hypothetical protein [Micromonosporaceae bacterium]
MTGLKASVVIPYKQRLHNIRTVFASLADQTMDPSQFEVVVGAMEYAEDYVAACHEFTDRITVVSVLSAEPWNVSRARNLALRQASGEVTVFLDADMVLPPHLLQNLYDRYFADGQNLCVLGQAIGYSCVVEHGHARGVDSGGERLPYSHYRDAIADLETSGGVWADDRFVLASVPLPWTLCWSGLAALPTATLRDNDLTFDEGFRGWGLEDQEWGYRIHATGTPLVPGENVYGLHMPHARDTAAESDSHTSNSRYFLAKWPTLGTELSSTFGWEQANIRYAEAQRQVTAAAVTPDHTLGIAYGKANGLDMLIVGAVIEARQRVLDPDIRALFDDGSTIEVLPLAGLALPYGDKTFDECRIMPSIFRLSAEYRDLVCVEAARVASTVVPCPSAAPEVAAE